MRKSLRIKNAREFQSIIGKRHFYTNKCFVLYHVSRSDANARVGITVSKKLGNAVVRNRIKRQCRMMFQQLMSFNEKFDVICIIRGGYLAQGYHENKKELETLLKKIKIYYDAQSMKEINDERI
jgi:ribonuclease P protein component